MIEDLPEAHVPCGLLAAQTQEVHRQEGKQEGTRAGAQQRKRVACLHGAHFLTTRKDIIFAKLTSKS